MTPEVNAAVWALRPDYVAVSIVARGCRNEVSSAPTRIVSVGAPRPAWAEAHLASRHSASAEHGVRCGFAPNALYASRHADAHRGAAPSRRVNRRRGTKPRATCADLSEADSQKRLTSVSAGLFSGAAIYINAVEHPARLACGTELRATASRPDLHHDPPTNVLFVGTAYSPGDRPTSRLKSLMKCD
jgi:hypothetical protein